MTFVPPAARPAALAAALCCLVGCDDGVDRPETVAVSGTVLLAGQPLKDATITMSPIAGNTRPAVARSKEDGTFRMQTYMPGDGVIPGEYKITVSKASEPTKSYDAPGDESEDYAGSTDRGFEEGVGPQELVPERYTKAATSDLRAVVESGRPIEGMTLDLAP